MIRMRVGTALAAGALLLLGGCKGMSGGGNAAESAPAKVAVTITTDQGAHVFTVEVARTPAEQERGLMFRTDIPRDGGMLFAPYPPGGGAPKTADFWMENTPTPLDILFIRPDGTIARIADNTPPFSRDHIRSGEPVSAVLELVGGRAAELGISEGDTVTWSH